MRNKLKYLTLIISAAAIAAVFAVGVMATVDEPDAVSAISATDVEACAGPNPDVEVCNLQTLISLLDEAAERDVINNHIVSMFTQVTANMIGTETGESRAEVISRVSQNLKVSEADRPQYTWICEAYSPSGSCLIYGKAPLKIVN